MNEPIPFTPVTIGIAVMIFLLGVALAWFWSRLRARELSARVRELDATASGNQSVEAELRRQSLELKAERDLLREKLEMEQQRRASAESSAEKARENINEQRKLLDERERNLRTRFRGWPQTCSARVHCSFWSWQIPNLNRCVERRKGIWNNARWRLKGWCVRWVKRWAI